MKMIRSRRQESLKELKRFHGKFTSIIFDLRVKLIEEFGNKEPPNISFLVGYFGQQNKKLESCTPEDLDSVHSVHSSPSKRIVNLWCECGDNDEESGAPKSKRSKITQ